MYYEERFFNGEWQWRMHPDGEFKPFDKARYCGKIATMQKEIEYLQEMLCGPDTLRGKAEAEPE